MTQISNPARSERLSAYLDHELDEAQTRAVEELAARDPDVRRELEELSHYSWENQLSWSNDGKTILFHSSLDGPDYDTWAIPATGGTPVKVTGVTGSGDYDHGWLG